MKAKTFDCIQMKRKGAERLLNKLSAMTPEQELGFWQKQTIALREQQNLIKEAAKTPGSG